MIADVKPPEWQRRSACAGVDPEIFFPTKGGGGGNIAKRVCARCPVRRACLAWAVNIEAEVGRMPGVYGGMSSNERRPLYVSSVCKNEACDEPVVANNYRYCAAHTDLVRSKTSGRK